MATVLLLSHCPYVDTSLATNTRISEKYCYDEIWIATTSIRSVKIEKIVKSLCETKPLLYINIRDVTVKDIVKLKKTIKDIAKRLKAAVKESNI